MPEFKTPFTDLISFLLDPSGNCCNEGDSGVPWRWSFIDPSFELSLSLLASNEEIEKINWSVIIVCVCTSITQSMVFPSQQSNCQMSTVLERTISSQVLEGSHKILLPVLRCHPLLLHTSNSYQFQLILSSDFPGSSRCTPVYINP